MLAVGVEQVRTVWKYSLPLSSVTQKVEVNEDAILLYAGMDSNSGDAAFGIWFDTEDRYAQTRFRYFQVVGTGSKVPDDGLYVATFTQQMTETQSHWSQGYQQFVWHLFELEA